MARYVPLYGHPPPHPDRGAELQENDRARKIDLVHIQTSLVCGPWHKVSLPTQSFRRPLCEVGVLSSHLGYKVRQPPIPHHFSATYWPPSANSHTCPSQRLSNRGFPRHRPRQSSNLERSGIHSYTQACSQGRSGLCCIIPGILHPKSSTHTSRHS